MAIGDIPGMEKDVTEQYSTELPDDLQESLELLVKRDNPMSDAAERTLELF